MAERSKAAVLKTAVPETVPGVRIPLSPPVSFRRPSSRRPRPVLGPVILALLLLAAAVACVSPPSAEPDSPTPGDSRPELTPLVRQLLDEIQAADTGQLAVSEADGQFLRTLVVASRTQRALEIGGASGYSAIWLGLGLRETGGTLVTIEYEPDRARALQENVRRAGLADIVRVVEGDALQRITELLGTFDLVFVDAWKPDYQRYFELTFPRLERRGLLLAHNVVNKRDEMRDFLETIATHPDLLTSIVSPGTEGISISVRR
jgi:predicted O-methyltransferase YrrM